MQRFVAPLAVICLAATPALAQQPPTPTPGAEHARVGYFAGTWQYEGEAQESPMGPGGKISSTETCEWFAGNFNLVCRSEGTTPRGRLKAGAVWGYDPIQQKYTYYGYNSFGEAFYVLGQAAGKVWTWTFELPAGPGATAQGRVLLTEESPAAYTTRFEMSTDGNTWTTLETGRSTKRR